MLPSLRARLTLPRGSATGFAAALATSVLLLVAPVYSNGDTLVKVNGLRAFGVLAIPLVIALAALASRRLKIISAIAMSAFAVIASPSIGLFYLPSAVVLFWPERQ